MPDWTAFGAVAGLVLVLVLGLARVTTAAMTTDGADAGGADTGDDGIGGDDTGSEGADAGGTAGHAADARSAHRSSDRHSVAEPSGGSSHDVDRKSEQQPPRSEADDGAGETALGDRETPRDGVSNADEEQAAAASNGGAVGDASAGPNAVDAAANRGAAADPDAGRVRRRDERGQRAATGEQGRRPGTANGAPGLGSISTTALLVNVVLTHGVLAAVLIGAAGLTEIPAAALGVTPAPWSTGLPAVLGGVALGGALAVANGAIAANLDRFGIDYSDELRTALVPESAVGWAVLLVVILPLVSLFEELLFRGVLVGGAAAATGISPWPFVVLSSIAFAMGHGLQGRGGILVTGSLGGVLAVAFVLSESLLLVIVAHYVVNAAEFLLHEWLGVDVHERLAV